MNARLAVLILSLTVAALFPASSRAAVVFGPGSQGKYVAPGEEELSGTVAELFHKGQEAEKRGDLHGAIKAYKAIVRKHNRDALAAGAAFRAAELYEQLHSYLNAAESYRYVVERFPTSPHFEDAIEAQFRIGEMYLNGQKIKVLGISFGNSLEHAVEVFAAVVRTAPYGKYTARAQFDIGLAREKQKINDAAITAYEAVVEKFPNDPLAPNAQYQIGYLWLNIAKAGTKDVDATAKARTAFEDFLFRYPNSEKAPQARANLEFLSRKQTSSAFDIAKYYDKQKHYRAAVIYYNEVIRQQPGSSESEKAKQRIDQIKAKVGEKALMPVMDEQAVAAAKKKGHGGEGSARSQSPAGDAAASSAPLPPPETDTSLPPAASLLPDSTTAPPTDVSGSSTGSLDSAGPPSADSASPGATPSPAP
ncbi:MAG TPA: outer membrane protein assembly factor BamD [Chthoniobacterales bacterium]